MLEGGCAGAPKGAIRIEPLAPSMRVALSEALLALGFELVDRDAELDVLANVEWRGTDTIALRLHDARGRLIEQASFRRSLERCRNLPNLTWDSCWAANYPHMKEALRRPLQGSASLQALARRARFGGAEAAQVEAAPSQPRHAAGLPAGSGQVQPDALSEQLHPLQVQETVARYRETLQRSCWVPALEARDPSAPSAARVSTTLTIAPNGSVESISASGDSLGYPHLASCIVAQLRQWSFPPTRSSSVVSVPFVFASD